MSFQYSIVFKKRVLNMIILAIETSCDDTCIAVVETKGQKRSCFKILSNIISSQTEIHKKYGGIYPSLAKREHQKNLPFVLEKALNKAKKPALLQGRPKIDLIAVTVGPGLDPCLWTGINFAKELAKKWDLPIIPVNHIEGHIVANFVGSNSKFFPYGGSTEGRQNFPAICLVVSGGHTQLILMRDIGKYKILGETRDDAAGECFDKVARILGLGYPGGPIIEKQASQCKSQTLNIKLPRPMINQKNYDFSFSGLKTAVLYKKERNRVSKRKLGFQKEFVQEMCKEVQQAIIDVLIKKTIKAAKDYRIKTIILGGGVSANKELRKQFKSKWEHNLLVPIKEFSTDNAVMIAIAGYYNYLQGKTRKSEKIKAIANLRIE